MRSGISAMAVLACLLAGSPFCPPAGAAQPPAASGIWRLTHPASKFVIGLDWTRAKASPAGRMIARQLESAQSHVKNSGFGLNALLSLDRLLISGTEFASGGSGAPSDFIIAIEGKIDRAAVKKGLPPGTAVERFKGVDLYVPPKGKAGEPLLAILSDQAALLGDRESLALILDGRGGISDAALAGRAARMAAECEMWMVAAGPLAKPAGAPMSQFDDIQSVDLGVTLQAGLGLRGVLISKSEEGAKGLATLMQLLISMAAQDGASGPGAEIASIMKNLQVTTEGTGVNFSLNIPLAELERGILQAKSAAQEVGKRSLESFLGVKPSGRMPPGLKTAVHASGPLGPQSVVALPGAPAERRTRTIRITGAEGGPKEITYSPAGAVR